MARIKHDNEGGFQRRRIFLVYAMEAFYSHMDQSESNLE
jgi:hypothetical protein